MIFFTKLIFFIYTKTDLVSFLMNQIIFFYLQKQILIFFLKRGYIHQIDLCELVLVKCVMYVQHIIHIMQKRVYWSLEFRRPDPAWAKWVPTLSHSVTQPLNIVLFGQVDLCFAFLFYLWVDCNQDKKPCILLVDCNQDSKPCKIRFAKIVSISIQSMTMNHFDHVILYLFFLIFFV